MNIKTLNISLFRESEEQKMAEIFVREESIFSKVNICFNPPVEGDCITLLNLNEQTITGVFKHRGIYGGRLISDFSIGIGESLKNEHMEDPIQTTNVYIIVFTSSKLKMYHNSGCYFILVIPKEY